MEQFPTVVAEDIMTIEVFTGRIYHELVSSRELGSPVFHYTTGEAGVSIIESAALRATNAAYLNDSQELQHAIEFMRILTLSRQQDDAAELAPFIRTLLALLDQLRHVTPDVWVVSFTERRDSTQHWHTYGGTSHG